ncbi:MAG TPA: redoxin domain-containing protein [Solirubrobacteraceae bacterium]|jgi:alkyl hydroperoxide reductase subunit AhpC/carbonic anhydrase|nr:redoxin domain-containing protein [Solirubrobacteraceae bacterium]
MSTTDELLTNAAAYEAAFDKGDLPLPPARKVAVLACMDARLNPYGILGLEEGDAHVIRNAGGVVTDDEIRSLAISQRLLGTEEIVLIHHTDCGMLTFTDDEFKRSIQDEVGIKPKWPAEAFTDLHQDVRQSIARIKASPFIPRKESVRGFVYHVENGELHEVDQIPNASPGASNGSTHAAANGSAHAGPDAGGRLALGETAPDFVAETTDGQIRFHDWIGDSWAVLFSHPRNFTPVCSTELGYLARIKPEFDRRGVKIIGLSVDPVENHATWVEDIVAITGSKLNYPLIGDHDFNVSKLYGLLPADVAGDPTKRTPADNQTVRNVFVIGPDKKVKLVLVYPMTTGRNFDEVLRVIDSLRLTAEHKVATPAQWRAGDDVIIVGAVSDDEAREKYPDGWDAPRPYVRIVAQPR